MTPKSTTRSTDKIILVSADGHAGAPPSAYEDYLEAKHHGELLALEEEDAAFARADVSQRRYKSETLEIIDASGAIRANGEEGAYDVDTRLRELDREGIVAEVILSGSQLNWSSASCASWSRCPTGDRAPQREVVRGPQR